MSVAVGLGLIVGFGVTDGVINGDSLLLSCTVDLVGLAVLVGETVVVTSVRAGSFSGTTISFALEVSAPAGTGRAVGKGVVTNSTTSSGNRPVNWPGNAQIRRGINSQTATIKISDMKIKARATSDPLFMSLFYTPYAANIRK
jgi:hypothetical protein